MEEAGGKWSHTYTHWVSELGACASANCGKCLCVYLLRLLASLGNYVTRSPQGCTSGCLVDLVVGL